MKKGAYTIYYTEYESLVELTEFTPNEQMTFFVATIDFNDCSIKTGDNKVYFDCLKEEEFLLITEQIH